MFRDIPGFESRYAINENGIVKNLRTGKKLSGTITANGYIRTYLATGKKNNTSKLTGKTYPNHRLVLETFGSKRPSEMHFVNHKDGVKTNNHISNLEWVTCSENIKHAHRIGLKIQTGSKNNASKINEKIALKIFNDKRKNQMDISRDFGVSPALVSMIRRGKRWAHIHQKAQ